MMYFEDIPYDGVICPTHCDGGVDTFGKSTTLVGWFGGPDEDPNH